MDWILSGLVIAGNLLIGRKNKWGWLVMAVSSVGFIAYALMLIPHQYGLIPSASINLVISISSARKWFLDERRKDK